MAKSTQDIKPPPKCKAILLCEQTIVAVGSGRVSVIGIIQELLFNDFPAQTRPMDIYLQLVDGIGRYEITIEIRDLAEDRRIARGTGPVIVFPDRLTTRQMALPIPALPIDHEGRYDLIMFANGQEIDRQQFTVSFFEEEGEES